MSYEPEATMERNDEDALLASLVGHTIASTDRSDNTDSGGAWLGSVVLTLDDGRRVLFEGWGHDWWGLSIEVVE